MKISIIIPVLNKWELTRACLKSLREHTGADSTGTEYQVLLVDNASTDATAVEAPLLGAALFGDNFIHLRQPVNRNFSASCNIGALAATGELLFFLNNDTYVTPGWLPPLLRVLQEADASGTKLGAVGPLLLYPELAGRPDRVQHLGICFEPGLYPAHLYEGFPAAHPAVKRRRRFQAITGAALLIRKELFVSAGMFDEEFINGFEDVELGLRLYSQGYFSTVEPDSVVYHLASQTPGIHRHLKQNTETLRVKSFGRVLPDLHAFGEQDGYGLRLTESAKPYLAILAAQEAGLADEFARNQCEDKLACLLDENPLWHDGYLRLGGLQEKKGDKPAALQTFFLALRFARSYAAASNVLRLAQETKNSKYAALAGSILRLFKPEYFDSTVEQTGFMREFGRNTGMSAIEKAYAGWLENKDEYRILFGDDSAL